MSLNIANIDLVAEKNELDAFLTKCLEIEVREDPPAVAAEIPPDIPPGIPPDQPKEAEALPVDPGELRGAPLETEPILEPEPLDKAAPFFEEAPSDQKQPPADETTEPLFAKTPAEGATVVEIEKDSAGKPDVIDIPLRPEMQAAARHTDELAQAQAKEDEITMERPQAAEPITNLDIKPELPRAELRSPYLAKSGAAASYAPESEKKKKSLFIFLSIFIAILIGAAVYFFVIPEMGSRSPEIISGKPNVDSSSQEQGRANTDQIHKKINRDGKQ